MSRHPVERLSVPLLKADDAWSRNAQGLLAELRTSQRLPSAMLRPLFVAYAVRPMFIRYLSEEMPQPHVESLYRLIEWERIGRCIEVSTCLRLSVRKRSSER